MSESQLINHFITSRVRSKLLRIFCKYPKSPVHVRAIAKAINEDPGNVARELADLEKIGFLNSTKEKNKKIYIANTDFIIYRELQAIILKTEPKVIL